MTNEYDQALTLLLIYHAHFTPPTYSFRLSGPNAFRRTMQYHQFSSGREFQTIRLGLRFLWM